jgi:hypothetical protein
MPIFLLFACLLFSLSTYATIYQVGPTRTYTMPSAVAPLVNNGDTIDIDAATYTNDVASWYDHDLHIRGVGNGYARLDANGNDAEGKAIWVIKGNNCRIENIEFLNCIVPDHNGAGIRQEGKGVHIKHCYFHHNEMGILAGDNTNSNICIEYSEFAFNGYGDGYSHNVYINHIDTFTFRYNYSHDPTVGHALKTRARYNRILYNRISEENGDGSYTIDVPNGGETIVLGNLIEQGPNSENSTIIEYGAEGINNPIADFIVVNNTIVNNRPSGTFFFVASATNLFKLYNNLVLGNGTYINGAPIALDSLGNKRWTSIATANLVNAAAFDYNLLATSPAIDAGVEAGMYGNVSLLPQNRYIHPQLAAARLPNGAALDVGAYELIPSNCTFSPAISGLLNTCTNSISTYSVPELLGSTYSWTISGGTIIVGQGTHQIEVQWNNDLVGTVDIIQTLP